MVKNLSCPNAKQETIGEMIQCKLGDVCSFQRYCGIVGGKILSYGAGTCLGRNKKPEVIPEVVPETQKIFYKKQNFIKKIINWFKKK